MIEILIYIALFIICAALIMIATEILYSLFAAIIPIMALLMVVVGCVVGFSVAIKNAFTVYKRIYFKKGK